MGILNFHLARYFKRAKEDSSPVFHSDFKVIYKMCYDCDTNKKTFYLIFIYYTLFIHQSLS